MPYRFNGVECDTVEELRALTGYPMNQVLASNNFVPEVKVQSDKTKKPLLSYIDGPGNSSYAPGVTWEDIDRGTHSEFGPK